jgi:iron complex transport system ATP-binding protein
MTLDVYNATFAYGDASVLDEVTLRVDDGELLGLLGPNGSGKTTLLQAIDGLLNLDEGSVTLDGTDVSTLSREETARRVGYLPQVEGSTPAATVFDTVLLGRTPHFEWRPAEEDRRAVERILSQLGIEDLAMREVPTLSGGQRRTVLLARALVGAPDALLLDEPTSGLDLKHQHEVMRHIQSAVHEADRAGIVAIHDLSLATRFCDRYALLYDGEIFEAGDEDVLTAENVGTVYDVPVEVFTRNGRTHVVPKDPGADRPPTPGSADPETPVTADSSRQETERASAAGGEGADGEREPEGAANRTEDSRPDQDEEGASEAVS